MKTMYWSPKKASRGALAAMACVAIAGLMLVELCKRHVDQSFHTEKLAAAENAAAMMHEIKAERLQRGYTIDSELDPHATGMIGFPVTAATTAVGHVKSKQAAANPNLAAAVVEMLHEAGVERGDVVAVGYSGSFPGGNIAVLAAVAAVGAEPIILGSVGASQYGANDPDFLWPDIQRLLYERRQTPFRMTACSLGGASDRALGLDEEGRDAMKTSVARNNLPLIGGISFAESIDERMALYDQHAAGREIKAYLNVGGGTLSVGRRLGKSLYKLGLNTEPPAGIEQVDGIIPRFFARGLPVIHLVGFDRLANRYGIATASGQPTALGSGEVYALTGYNPWLTAAVLLSILLGMKFFVLSDAPSRLAKLLTPRRQAAPPAPTLAIHPRKAA